MPPISTDDTFQDLCRMPETTDSSKPYTQVIFCLHTYPFHNTDSENANSKCARGQREMSHECDGEDVFAVFLRMMKTMDS